MLLAILTIQSEYVSRFSAIDFNIIVSRIGKSQRAMATTGTNLEGLGVFVSYPRGGHGHTWAEAVQRHLEQLGAEVWRDEESIREGEQDWYHRIEQGLEKADLLTCIVGQDTDHCV
jgi:hypothetical protein